MLKARNCILPGYQNEKSWSESFWFVVGADTQLGLEEQIDALLENRKPERLCWQVECDQNVEPANFIYVAHNIYFSASHSLGY